MIAFNAAVERSKSSSLPSAATIAAISLAKIVAKYLAMTLPTTATKRKNRKEGGLAQVALDPRIQNSQ